MDQIDLYIRGIILELSQFILFKSHAPIEWTLDLHNLQSQFDLNEHEVHLVNSFKNCFSEYQSFLPQHKIHIREVIGETLRLNILYYSPDQPKKAASLRLNTKTCCLISRNVEEIGKLTQHLYIILDEVHRRLTVKPK